MLYVFTHWRPIGCFYCKYTLFVFIISMFPPHGIPSLTMFIWTPLLSSVVYFPCHWFVFSQKSGQYHFILLPDVIESMPLYLLLRFFCSKLREAQMLISVYQGACTIWNVSKRVIKNRASRWSSCFIQIYSWAFLWGRMLISKYRYGVYFEHLVLIRSSKHLSFVLMNSSVILKWEDWL